MVEDGVAPSIFGLIERGIAARARARRPDARSRRLSLRRGLLAAPHPVQAAQRGRRGWRLSETRTCVIDRAASRTSSTSRRCRPCRGACTACPIPAGRAAVGRSRRLASGRVRLEGDRVARAPPAAAARGLARDSERARSISSRTPKPVGPLPTYSRPDVPGGARDVEVDPGLAVHELLQERAARRSSRPCAWTRRWSGRRPCPWSAPCTPGAAAGARPARRSGSPPPRPSAAKASSLEISAGVGGAERDDHRAGQRGQVDEPLGAELDGSRRGRRRGSAGPRRRCC